MSLADWCSNEYLSVLLGLAELFRQVNHLCDLLIDGLMHIYQFLAVSTFRPRANTR